MSTQSDILSDESNPLDHVEEVLSQHNWVFNRMTDDELMVQVTGKCCQYRIFFLWQEDMGAMQFCCQYDLNIGRDKMKTAADVLMNINENLWMGHFDIPKETGTPSFRQTCLLRGVDRGPGTSEQIADLVDISMAQCERFYPVFQMLSNDNLPDDQNLSLALMETQGDA